jgi:predicted SnoaL-like aldol condensation-catalyzing enzyme
MIRQCRRERGGGNDSIDIFPFDDTGRAVEHWDALPVVPEESASTNGML